MVVLAFITVCIYSIKLYMTTLDYAPQGRTYQAIKRMRFTIFSLIVCISLLAGCTQVPPQQSSIRGLEKDLKDMKAGLARAENEIAHLRNLRYASEAEVAGQFTVLSNSVDELGERLLRACRQSRIANAPEPADCNNSAQRVLVSNSGKMVLGEIEHVWVAEPGFVIVARVDTGASSSSLHAENITEFERDGDDWVRFDLVAEKDTVTIERPVGKYVRVYQQADKSGSRRPVVELRIRLGDVQDTFEFTLADRSHLEHNMILGRNFLTDMAMVDVSQKFIQPAQQPSASRN